VNVQQRIARLRKLQLAHGGFVAQIVKPNSGKEVQTVFIPALIGLLLCAAQTRKPQLQPELTPVLNRLADFLQSQVRDKVAVNYWPAGNVPEDRVYPDDLDDTAVTWLVLSKLRPQLITEAWVRDLALLLRKQEVAVGGPYCTWVVTEEAPAHWRKDVDVVVNAHLAALLAEQGVQLPGLQAYLDQCIAEDQLTTAFYPSSVPAMLALSWSYAGKQKQALQAKLLHLAQGCTSRLEQLVLRIAAANLGTQLPDLPAITSEGSWYIDHYKGKAPQLLGSEALVLAAELLVEPL